MSSAAACRDDCGILERSWTTLLEMTGDDRVRFLQGYVTCDVNGLVTGQGTSGFFTTVKGRVMADVRVLALADRLWLEVPGGTEEGIAEHLRKYVIADRVEIAPLAGWTALAVLGPRAEEILRAGGELPDETHRHQRATLHGHEALIVRDLDVGVPQWTVWTREPVALAERLGVPRVERASYEVLRVEAGRPLFGQDFGDDCFPQETGLEDETVSYTKGCYLGQEVVARIHYRGGVQRRLRGLRFDAATTSPLGRALVHDGREAGTVTSAVESPVLGSIGLSIVHQRVEPGAHVEVEGGGRAEVVALPFAMPV